MLIGKVSSLYLHKRRELYIIYIFWIWKPKTQFLDTYLWFLGITAKCILFVGVTVQEVYKSTLLPHFLDFWILLFSSHNAGSSIMLRLKNGNYFLPFVSLLFLSVLVLSSVWVLVEFQWSVLWLGMILEISPMVPCTVWSLEASEAGFWPKITRN